MGTALTAWAGAAALGLATPVCAQPAPAAQLAPGEILLHVGAQGSTPADSATVTVDVAAQGASKEEAEAARAKIEKDVLAALAEAGIARSSVELGEASYSDYADYLEAAVSGVVDIAEPPISDAEAGDTEDGAYDTPAEARWNASSVMNVTVEDLSNLENVRHLAAAVAYATTPRPVFAFRDEAKSKRAAIANALAQARADAEAYADALGYRIVRIAAVSNDGPEMSFPGFLQTMMALDTAGQDWSLLGQKTVPITVDFVIAPK